MPATDPIAMLVNTTPVWIVPAAPGGSSSYVAAASWASTDDATLDAIAPASPAPFVSTAKWEID